jgi:hypothetical protein
MGILLLRLVAILVVSTRETRWRFDSLTVEGDYRDKDRSLSS